METLNDILILKINKNIFRYINN